MCHITIAINQNHIAYTSKILQRPVYGRPFKLYYVMDADNVSPVIASVIHTRSISYYYIFECRISQKVNNL
jgi:hypothetical protein